MMWFSFVDERFWFHTPQPEDGPSSPFLTAAETGQLVSVMAATFNPPDDVRQIRTTGHARIEADSWSRTAGIYERYIDGWSDTWRMQAQSPRYRLWSMSPDRGMAVSYPSLQNSVPFRWSTRDELLDALRTQ